MISLLPLLATATLPHASPEPAPAPEAIVITETRPPTYGPLEITEPASTALHQPYSLKSFGRDAGTVKWELAGVVAAVTATRFKDITKGGGDFRFKSEGFFGKNTTSLGMDKLHHAWKTYVLADVLQGLIEARTGDNRSAAFTGAALGVGVMTYAEVLDGFTKRTGFSNEDFAIHFAGAGFALVRNAVPGLRQKLDFRTQIDPSGFGKDLRLVDQLAERRFLFAAQLSGWKRFEDTPWRFVELHAGYFARGFTDAERARGEPLKRRLYVGVGFNVQQLFARKPKSFVGRVARGAFDYIQLPYTSVNTD